MNSSHAGGGSSPRSEPEVPALDASRFEMLEQIGTGGMGSVYRAVQRSVGRHVAVKVLAPEHAANATGLARFVREANIVARLTHPNLVQLIDFGRDRDGNLLLVMELLEGESLRHVIRRESRLAPERAAYITVQCLNALRVAHAAGVIHRDLKPENIFLHRVGDDDHVKVLDFGVAKLTQNDVSDQHTTQGSLVGTLRYMAPEQVAGETPDAASTCTPWGWCSTSSSRARCPTTRATASCCSGRSSPRSPRTCSRAPPRCPPSSPPW